MSVAADREGPSEAAGFWRRLGAVGYDLLLLGSLLLATTAGLIAATGAPIPAGTWYHQALLALISFVYFGVAWTRSGQTLGMKTWRIRVRTFDGRTLGWGRAALRFAAAGISLLGLGLGFAWVLVDAQRMSWHDRLSRTVLVLVPRA